MKESYHFIGIGGIGMSGLARLLLSRNIVVSGSDIAVNSTIESLIREGAVVHKGHSAGNIPAQAKVVYTSGIQQDNPEFQAALALKSPMLHRSDLLAALLEGYTALAVAGTHGKTTTTALLASVLVHAGFDPSFAVGGIVSELQSNAKLGKGEFFPFEADESDKSFLKYHPFGAIVTNIGQDHLIAYDGSFSQLIDSFKIFASQVKSSNHFFWCKDDVNLSELNLPGQSYGCTPSSDWRITSFCQTGYKMVFDLEHKQERYPAISLSLSGKHNVLNAAGVFGLAITLGVPEGKIREAFENFRGVHRRCEDKGSIHGVTFLDDYAHHPVEIKTTLEGIKRAVYPKRVIAVFQPHRYSRTKDCIGQYGTIFNDADEVVVTDIYAAGEQPIPGISYSTVIEEVKQHSEVPCRYVPRPALSHFMAEFVRPYDVVATLGAGDITKLSVETMALLENHQSKPIRIALVGSTNEIEQFMERVKDFSYSFFKWVPIPMLVHSQNKRGEGLSDPLKSKMESIRKHAKISSSLLGELQGCDAAIPMKQQECESTIHGFLDILGIPYSGSGPREIWLSREIDYSRHLLVERGIKALSTHLTLSGDHPQGDSFDFYVGGTNGKAELAAMHMHPSSGEKNPQDCIPQAYLAKGVELAKRIFSALQCKRCALIRILRDPQSCLWFDRLIPLNGCDLLTFHSLNASDREAVKAKTEEVLLEGMNTFSKG